MCQYSSENGVAGDWHLVHLGSRAVGGAALVMTEAATGPKERTFIEKARRQQLVAAYNSAIATVTKQDGDVLVDVHATILNPPSGSPIVVFREPSAGPVAVFASEGLLPRGAALFAQAFERSMKHQPDSRP